MRVEQLSQVATSDFGVSELRRSTRSSETAGSTDAPSFGDALVTAFERASEAEREAGNHVARFIEGNAGIHETVMAHERAGLMLRYAVTLKNRAIDAYRELMNTQV